MCFPRYGFIRAHTDCSPNFPNILLRYSPMFIITVKANVYFHQDVFFMTVM
ncbi:hypothetical protein HNR44_000942 [Geomicrobium halophilum]|uniref:Uncharacterized protein n=1 Tax=Geomicrobium halophilum TaxID=549000 RepID=A0A841PX56_9BACL|nr:hypothetical protein [Geomicrobium halophilum]